MNMPTDKANPILDRISSPITASFICSWVIWNYNLVLYFFDGGMTPDQKILQISEASSWGQCFWGPASTGALYLIVMPYFLHLYKMFSEHMRKKDALLVHHIDNEIHNNNDYNTKYSRELVVNLIEYLQATHELAERHQSNQRNILNSQSMPSTKITQFGNSLNIFQNNLQELHNNSSLSDKVKKNIMGQNTNPAAVANLRSLLNKIINFKKS